MCRETIELIVGQGAEGRLDAYITAQTGTYTRSFVKTLIDRGCVTVNGSVVKAGYKPKVGDMVVVKLPVQGMESPQAQDVPLDIVYQDADIAVINKAQGMVTHPAAGNADGTLVNAVMFHIKDLSGIGGEMRPGIVHRLDKDTSGLIVIAKNDAAHERLSAQLQNRSMKKTYLALLHGNLKTDRGTIITGIDRHPKDRKKMAVTHTGREAVTHFAVLERFGQYTLVEFTIETGRTHQIRVHAKHMGHPVVGDAVYTKLKNPFGTRGQLLHAACIRLEHPTTGEEMAFTAPLPAHFEKILRRLQKKQ